jgi:hypothetical protein
VSLADLDSVRAVLSQFRRVAGALRPIRPDALAVFVLRFKLPESPRWLVAHAQGDKALAILAHMKLPTPSPGQKLVAGSTTGAVRDPLLIVFRKYPLRMVAGPFQIKLVGRHIREKPVLRQLESCERSTEGVGEQSFS